LPAGLVRRRRGSMQHHAEKIKHRKQRKQCLKKACIDLKNKINLKKSLVLSATSTTKTISIIAMYMHRTKSTPDCIYQYI
jgi:hypothetical protein